MNRETAPLHAAEPSVTFLGAAGEVTGSCMLFETSSARFLVDCGMFQGDRAAFEKNRRALDFDPHSIDFVILTHAHIDHSGLIPRFWALGYRGPVYATPATMDLLAVMLPDSGHIQEHEAAWKLRRGRKLRRAATDELSVLYTYAQAQESLALLRGVDYERDCAPAPGVRFRYRDAGHILGSAITEIWIEHEGKEIKIVVSGDLGQPHRPVVRDPATIAEADYLIIESTYGDRNHRSFDATIAELVEAVTDTLTRKQGNVVIPAFSVGRTQEILFLLARLAREGKLPQMQIYVDSPMATRATEVTLKHQSLLDPEMTELTRLLTHPGARPRIRFVENVEESRALNDVQSGAIIISASGMCEAGRIKHHLRHHLGHRQNSIIFAGFQAEGTLGRRIVDGAASVNIFAERVPVRADVYTLGALSAHADQAALMAWVRAFEKPPAQVFVVHGEPPSSDALAAKLGEELHLNVMVAQRLGRVVLRPAATVFASRLRA